MNLTWKAIDKMTAVVNRRQTKSSNWITSILRVRWLLAISIVASLMLSSSQVLAARYTAIDLGPGQFPVINDVGQVAFTGYVGGLVQAMLYTPGFGTTAIGQFGPTGINDLGQICGTSTSFSSLGHAVVYTPGQGIFALGTLGGPSSQAFGINNSGQVVGVSSTGETATANSRAFLYTPGIGMVNLAPQLYFGLYGELPPFGTSGLYASVGEGINDAGEVVGEFVRGSSGGVEGFAYSPSAGLVVLPPLGHSAGMHPINSSGQVLGAGSFGINGFLYTPGVGIETLPPFGVAINDAGQYVGSSLYTPGIGYQDLDSLISNPFPHVGIQFGINNSSQIVGVFQNGSSHVYLLTPVPEPASVILALTGFAVLFLSKRSRRG